MKDGERMSEIKFFSKEEIEPTGFINEILEVAKSFIKKDESAIAALTYTYLSRWTKEPLNLFLKGESSIGKSYVTINTINILGKDKDVWNLGGLTPKALIRGHGTLKDENGIEIGNIERPSRNKIKLEHPEASKQDIEEMYNAAVNAWNELIQNSYYEINLEGKLLVFLEPPNLETFQILRPILSHDTERISYRFPEKTKSGSIRTINVVLKGFPATIFCTSEEEYLKDLSTRSLTLTPELSVEKVKESVNLISKLSAYSEKLLSADTTKIKTQMDKIKVKAPKDVLTPFSEQVEKYIEYWGKRVMRDWKHLLTMVKMNALLNFESRPKIYIDNQPYLLASASDYITVLKFWSEIEETTITGISGSALEVFEKLIKPTAVDGITNYTKLTEKSKEVMSEPLTSSTLRFYIKALKDVGLIETFQDPENPRKKVIKVISEGRTMFGNEALKYIYSQNQHIFTGENLKQWLKTLYSMCWKKRVSLKADFSFENLLKKLT